MLNKIIRTGFICALAVLSLPVGAAAPEGIAPEKAALIQELLEVTQSRKNAEAVLRATFDQTDQNLKTFLSQSLIQDKNLSPRERSETQQGMTEMAQTMSRRYREVFQKRVNFPQLMEEISMTLYDRHFTEAELRDMVVFYRTPTGQKTIQVMPQLYSESMRMTSERLMPVQQEVFREVVQEVTARMKRRSLAPRTASPRKAAPRRRGAR